MMSLNLFPERLPARVRFKAHIILQVAPAAHPELRRLAEEAEAVTRAVE